MTQPKPRYSVTTWNPDTQEHTPQAGLGVRSQMVTLWGLRRALRALRELGYTCHRMHRRGGGYFDEIDDDVYVQRIEPTSSEAALEPPPGGVAPLAGAQTPRTGGGTGPKGNPVKQGNNGRDLF